MSHFRARQRLAAGLIALFCWAVGAESAVAQQADEQVIKAGFIYNFIKFTQWSAAPEGETKRLLLCTTSDDPLEGHFSRLDGRAVGPRVLKIKSNVGTTEWSGCDVLFVAQSDADHVDSYLRHLDNAPILTIGDSPGFTKAGGMIGLRMQDKRVRFDVNLGRAQRAGLQLNSQMIGLAGEIIK